MSASQLLPQHRTSIEELSTKLGLDKFADRILAGAYSAFDLVGAKQGESRKRGTTRFGGQPDVPVSFDTSQLDELAFIFQVDLADLPLDT